MYVYFIIVLERSLYVMRVANCPMGYGLNACFHAGESKFDGGLH